MPKFFGRAKIEIISYSSNTSEEFKRKSSKGEIYGIILFKEDTYDHVNMSYL